MKDLIAYCGLDCEKCDARKATLDDDDKARREVAKLWSELNGIVITPDMTNCDGCRVEGRKTPFCDVLCLVKQCASNKGVETCGQCDEMKTCEKIAMIIANNDEALDNLSK